MCSNAGQTYAQAVFQCDESRFFNTGDAADVCAQTCGVKLIDVALDLGPAVVEVVVAERYKIIAAEVHHMRRDTFTAAVL